MKRASPEWLPERSEVRSLVALLKTATVAAGDPKTDEAMARSDLRASKLLLVKAYPHPYGGDQEPDKRPAPVRADARTGELVPGPTLV
jgi:hypothetical protein